MAHFASIPRRYLRMFGRSKPSRITSSVSLRLIAKSDIVLGRDIISASDDFADKT